MKSIVAKMPAGLGVGMKTGGGFSADEGGFKGVVRCGVGWGWWQKVERLYLVGFTAATKLGK